MTPGPGDKEMRDREAMIKAHRAWAVEMARSLSRPLEELELENLGRVPWEAAWKARDAEIKALKEVIQKSSQYLDGIEVELSALIQILRDS